MGRMHLLAYTVNSAGGVTNQDMPAVTDGWASVFNNHYVLQRDMYIRFMIGLGVNLQDIRVNTPYLRQWTPSYAGPVDTAATPTSLPAISWQNWPFTQIKAIDETAMESTDAAVAGQLYGFLGLCTDNNVNLPSGPMFTLRFTAANTTGNKVWSASAMTFGSVLPAGRYSVVGMDVWGANLIAARLFFPDAGPHPGVIARTALANKPDPMFLSGELGEFGQFESTAPPQLECFANGAPTTQIGYLKLIQVRAGRGS